MNGETVGVAVFAFDFFNTLDTPAREDVRGLVRKLHALGHEIHIVSAISPGLPMDNDEAYAKVLGELNVPFTKVWRVDHKPELKVAVLLNIRATAYWDDVLDYVNAARVAGISTCHVGKDPHNVTTRVYVETLVWGLGA